MKCDLCNQPSCDLKYINRKAFCRCCLLIYLQYKARYLGKGLFKIEVSQ